MVLQMQNVVLDTIPETVGDNDGPEVLDDFFDANPDLCENNIHLNSIPHRKMGRDQVLFIRQRMQATSDIRENPKVRYIGSHAALTCHIAVMRHVITGVVSVGHFDNFCCWQYGQDSSAHKDGIKLMLEEIAALSSGYADHGRVEVSVVGGYTDARGDAARNSLSLLKALHEDPRLLELRHFCVGRFNTVGVDPRDSDNLLRTETTAILKGIAVDLRTQQIFPANFEWGNYADFKMQIADRFRTISGKDPIDTEERNKTADSTFKPKSLRNRAYHDKLLKEQSEDGGEEDSEESSKENLRKSRRKAINSNLNPAEVFKVKLKPTVINDKTSFNSSTVNKRRKKYTIKAKAEKSCE